MKYYSRFTRMAQIILIICMVSVSMVSAQPQRLERPREAVTSPTVGISQSGTPPVVKIWTDKGDDRSGNTPIYYVGEQIYISF